VAFPLPAARLFTHVHVDSWWDGKPKCFADFREVKLFDIEYFLEGIRRIRLQVGSVTLFGGLVKVIIFREEFLELQINQD